MLGPLKPAPLAGRAATRERFGPPADGLASKYSAAAMHARAMDFGSSSYLHK
jgi:hypothetical protein